MNTNPVNDSPGHFDETKKKLKQYINQRILLMRMQATEKASRLASALITITIIVIVAIFILIFGSIAAGYWLSGLTGSYAIGFGCVALFYFLALLFIIFFLRKILLNLFVDRIIKYFFKQDEHDNQ
ncbi:MAG: phage holin family protein [Bacteroidetes bacterium]|nr:phage holin family protein [Bacteroidota bacterium]